MSVAVVYRLKMVYIAQHQRIGGVSSLCSLRLVFQGVDHLSAVKQPGKRIPCCFFVELCVCFLQLLFSFRELFGHLFAFLEFTIQLCIYVFQFFLERSYLEVSPHPRQQFRPVEWFNHVVDSSRVKPLNNTLFVGFCGKKKYRNISVIGAPLYSPAHFKAVYLRHHNIEENKIEYFVCRLLQSIYTVPAKGYTVALALEVGCY